MQHRENTGNFISARMWPPYINLMGKNEKFKIVSRFTQSIPFNILSLKDTFRKSTLKLPEKSGKMIGFYSGLGREMSQVKPLAHVTLY